MKPQDLQTLALAALTAPTFKPTATAELLAAKVDRLGALSAAMAALKKEADAIRTELEETGLPDIDGHAYRVNFSQCQGRTVTDWQAIAQRFKPSPQLVRRHTTTGEGSTRMTIKAHPTH